MKSVYCAVRTGSLNKAVCASSLQSYGSKRRICDIFVRRRRALLTFYLQALHKSQHL